MWAATPDPGVMKILKLRNGQQRVVFVNGFAANDPESTGKIWELMLARYQHQTRIALINCRADRRSRSAQLAEAAPHWSPADHYIAVGTGTEIFERVAIGSGLDPLAITALEGVEEEEIVRELVHRAGESAVVMGMGNTAGVGLGLVDYLEEHSLSDSREPVVPVRSRNVQIPENVQLMKEVA